MKILIIISSLSLLVSAFDENTLDVAKQKVAEGLDQLPDSVKSAIPNGLNMDNVPSIDEGEELLKERCEKYGTNESFDRVLAARSEVQFCFEGMVNFTEFQAEIEHAKPTGDLDIVFRKYCGKTPHLRGCVSNFTEAIEPCLNPDERILKETIINVTDALISFICFKEGDRIALFIAEEGPECLKSKQEQIQECINSTFSHYIPKDMPGKQEELPLFKMEEKECGDLRKLQKCVIKHLEKCLRANISQHRGQSDQVCA
ncbi:27 kDa hemolymph protein-like [Homalodisca vitripennis]|uniref:27 kDa hemolymph protein-like n=1 Tax=Homalodisca vitripennis TaxID=197043 RepID=UPI001EE9CBAB|nr:27 kDa hemolymph protein-like [Homalodisca vitripennis]